MWAPSRLVTAAMRVVKAMLVLATVTSWARGQEEEMEAVDIDEDDVGDEHHETPEEAEEVHMEEDPEGDSDEYELTKEKLEKIHAAVDTNKDGKINLDEMTAFGTKMTAIVAKKYSKSDLVDLDKNKDGKLSFDEYAKDMGFVDDEEGKLFKEQETDKFKAADDNGDGVLDEHELVHLFNPHLHSKVLEAETRGKMKQLDVNKDGKLSNVEFFLAHNDEDPHEEFDMSDEDKSHFSELDKDKDGFLDFDELQRSVGHQQHLQKELLNMIEIADMDGDEHLTASELSKSKSMLEGSDIEMYLGEWAHHGEL